MGSDPAPDLFAPNAETVTTLTPGHTRHLLAMAGVQKAAEMVPRARQSVAVVEVSGAVFKPLIVGRIDYVPKHIAKIKHRFFNVSGRRFVDLG